jgi:glucose/mannose transport system permease protein
MAGFVFSKYRFKGDRIILTIVTLGFYVSPQAILVPLIKFISLLGLYNTILGLILTHTAYGMPITTLLFKNYFDTIPKELIESAAIDGAGTATTYSRIMLPLSPPIFAVVSVFQFVNIWNEYLWGLVLTQGAASQTVQVAVANLKGTTLAAWNVQMAGATIAAIPTLMIYLIAFKLVIKGLIQGAVKG